MGRDLLGEEKEIGSCGVFLVVEEETLLKAMMR